MKKLLTLALVAGFAGMASAVTMQWAATLIAFNGTTLKNDGNVTGYLIALNSFQDFYQLTDTFTPASIKDTDAETGRVVDEKNKTSAVGKLANAWEIDVDNYDNGATFAVLLKYTGASDGKVYYNLSENLVTMENMSVDPPVNASNTASTFSYSTSSEKGKLKAGGGWTMVPEPSTAALALAGLALLIRRRRA